MRRVILEITTTLAPPTAAQRSTTKPDAPDEDTAIAKGLLLLPLFTIATGYFTK
jgi:hypothetical protein